MNFYDLIKNTEAKNSCWGYNRQKNFTMTLILFPLLFAKNQWSHQMYDDRVKSIIFRFYEENNDITLMTSLKGHAHVSETETAVCL